jgi:hypothetical protein
VLAGGQAALIVWRGSARVLSDAGPGGDLRVALAWTLLGIAALWAAGRRQAPELAVWIGTGLWVWAAALLWLQALAGKPLLA